MVKCLKKRSNIQTRLLDITKSKFQQEIIHTFHQWTNLKDRENVFVVNELTALSRLLATFSQAISPFFLTVGMYIDDKMVGFNINEILDNHFAVIHFEKGDTVNYPEIGAYLFQIAAKELSKHGVQHINLEQDLGLDGLRKNKLSYKPDYFLFKYVLKLKTI